MTNHSYIYNYAHGFRFLPLSGLVIVGALCGGFVLALSALLQAAAPLDAPQSFYELLTSDARIGYALQSALFQAALSTIGSVMVAVPLSVVMARRYHWFGMTFLRLMTGLAFVIPTTVAASGLLAVWGRQGVINSILMAISDMTPLPLLELPSFFGLKAVVLAHIFFNAPLMIRIFLPRILSVPENHWRLARMTGMTPRDQFRYIEWPAIRAMIIPMMVLVFLFCFSSFSLVLMLGGGPAVTTLEVEIYAAIRIAYDFHLAVLLTMMQIAVAVIMLLIMLCHPLMRQTMPQAVTSIKPSSIHILSSRSNLLKILDIICVLFLFSLLILPILALFFKGLTGDLFIVLAEPVFWQALQNSLTIALTTACCVSFLAMMLAETRYQLGLINSPTRWQIVARLLLESSVMITLVIPSIVMGTAMFILLRSYADIFAIAPYLVLTANILMGLPVSYRLISGKWVLARQQDQHLRLAYGMNRRTSLRFLIMPVMGRDIGLIFGMVAAMSMGDLGVIALFSSSDFKTLPWLLYEQAGRYRTDEASATAVLLMGVTIMVFILGSLTGRLLSRAPSMAATHVISHHEAG
ncbi:MAG: ABC transporter permease subunit [Alphaproteobacteria bacterium]|nr:ABC transporter permease subunit [Alphaproteobacteria bacterium]